MSPFLSPYDGTPAGRRPTAWRGPGAERGRPSADEGERVPQRRKSTSEGWMILAAEPSAAW